MKIAMFSWEALEGLSVGGGAVYASRLAAALARAGHRVRLFTRAGPGQAMEENVGGVMVRRCPWDRRPTFLEEIDALSHAFAHYFADSVKTEGPYDVVHCHEWFTIAAGLRAVEIAPARLAVSFHSTEWGRTGVWPDKGDSARISWLEREGVMRADCVVAASHWARRTIHEQFHPPDWKCEVIYHAADLPPRLERGPAAETIRRAAGLEADSPSALFAGRFSHQGGGDLAARAARIVAERFPRAKFLFVGAGQLEDDMRREAGAVGLFLPPQGRVVPDELYAAVDLILAPFRRDHNSRAVMPAWANGKPVVTLRDTVPAEFIVPGTTGWLVGPDPVELASAIIEAFGNPDQAAWMGRNGRVAAETAFSWDDAARRLVAAYTRRERLAPVTEAM
ncbi:MAG: glycosyltransferase family 4 protein [Planctomycetaceae bacterium]|nr:glycosyltransferase family 4 protein [Planctomycetaceae bacterium]